MPYTSLTIMFLASFEYLCGSMTNHNVMYIRKRYIQCSGFQSSLSTDDALDRLQDIRLILPGQAFRRSVQNSPNVKNVCRLVLPHSIGVYSNQNHFRKRNKTIDITNVIAEFHVKCFYLVTLELSNSTFVKNLQFVLSYLRQS